MSTNEKVGNEKTELEHGNWFMTHDRLFLCIRTVVNKVEWNRNTVSEQIP